MSGDGSVRHQSADEIIHKFQLGITLYRNYLTKNWLSAVHQKRILDYLQEMKDYVRLLSYFALISGQKDILTLM